MKRLIEIAKLLLGLPISFLALFFIIRLISTNTKFSITQLKDVQIFLLFCGILCFLVYFLFRALLWQKILQFKGHYFPFKETVFIWASSELKRYVPGNIWSFLSRFLVYSEKNVKKSTFFSSLVEEGQAVAIGSGLLSIFSFSFVFYTLSPYPNYAPVLLFLSYIVSLGIILFYLAKSFKKNSTFLLISLLSFFFFGLGTYLTISSLVFLSPLFITTFVSFFAFSYLLGYLSFIVPMGIGVREGVVTFGLSHFISLSLAGLGALFARIVIIFSELIFLTLAFFWYRSKNIYIKRLEAFIKKYRFEILLAFFIIIYCIYFTTASFLRYDNFFTGRFDLGNMDQTVWNTFRGRVFQLTNPEGTHIISRLAVHADFILILLAPLYKIWADPRMLLLVQTIVLSLGSVFVFLISKKILNNKLLALIFAFVYLINPSIQFTNLYDFHSISLATTFLLGSFYFLYTNKYLLFSIFAILSGLTKENIWIVNSLFGIYIILINTPLNYFNKNKVNYKKILFGIFIFLLSISIFYYLVWIAIPSARGAQHFAISYYSDFGDNPTSIVKNIVLSPLKTFSTILQPDRIRYLLYMFSPLGFLPIFTPFILIFSFPDFLIILLSNNSTLRQIYFHYASPITPFLFISSIFTINKIIKKFPRFNINFIYSYLIISALFSAYFFDPLPFSKNPSLDMFTKSQKNKEFIEIYLANIKKKYSVAATNNLGSHLSRRQRIYTIPLGIDTADIIVFLLNDPFAQPSLAAQKKMVEDLKNNSRYKLVFEKDEFVAFQRK